MSRNHQFSLMPSVEDGYSTILEQRLKPKKTTASRLVNNRKHFMIIYLATVTQLKTVLQDIRIKHGQFF